jgi:hypothetical protein
MRKRNTQWLRHDDPWPLPQPGQHRTRPALVTRLNASITTALALPSDHDFLSSNFRAICTSVRHATGRSMVALAALVPDLKGNI